MMVPRDGYHSGCLLPSASWARPSGASLVPEPTSGTYGFNVDHFRVLKLGPGHQGKCILRQA